MTENTMTDDYYKDRIFVGNVPSQATYKDLRAALEPALGTVVNARILRDALGESKRCALVDFRDAEHAARAIRLSQQIELFGQRLRFKPARRKAPDDYRAKERNKRNDYHAGTRTSAGANRRDLGGMDDPAELGGIPQVPPHF